jgi:hypothetical protein
MISFMSLAILMASVPFLPAQTAKEDMKRAGHESKEAAKDTAKGTKQAAKTTGHKVKRAAKKATQ